MKKILVMSFLCALGLTALPVRQASALFSISIYVTAPMTTLVEADAAILAGPVTYSALTSIIEYDDLGDGTTGLFSINNAFPGGANNTFALHATGSFWLGTAGTWTLGINHDDGARMKIDGLPSVQNDGVADNRNTTITNTFAAGLHTVDIVFFENAGGASLEFYGRLGSGPNQLMAVPEPSVMALLVLGLLGAGFGMRRKSS